MNVQPGTSYAQYGAVGSQSSDSGNCRLIVQNNTTSDFATLYVKDVCLFDLTQMFGTTIADYIYSLEGATAGAGVAYFRSLFPKDYYPYNEGETTCVSAVNGDEYRDITIQLGQTVYGGNLDVTNGVLTVTDVNIASYNGETLPSTWISSMDVYSSGATPTAGAQVVYKLATPITYQLTPQEVDTLLGTNNVWCDTGDTEVTYRADTKLYIQQLTQPTEDDMTANDNIASGKFFMIGNKLYLSTAAIASGATIVPGTNCTALSLADALNNLNT